MTNYEKNKELLDMYAVVNAPWGVDEDGKVFECDFCNRCIFREDGPCTQKRLEWLQEEYKEPEVDWSKVKIDTPVLVRDGEDEEWKERYFAGYFFERIHTFGLNTTSKNYFNIQFWKYAKLIEKESD